MSDVIVAVGGSTDIGRAREHNEDAFLITDLGDAAPGVVADALPRALGPAGLLLMVADGMGGAAAGELASAMAIETVRDEVRRQWAVSSRHDLAAMGDILIAATTAANDRIHGHAVEHPGTRGMGTTATVAAVVGEAVAIAQVGDSRAYLIRDGAAQQLTKDQSLLQRLLDAGEISAEEAEMSERRNIILQALGPESVITVDLTTRGLQRGDALVLCSDGLSGVVRPPEIASVVERAPDTIAAARQLIAAANARGGPDNITAIVARFDGDGLPGPPPRPIVVGPLMVPARPVQPAAPNLVSRIVRRVIDGRGDS